VYQLIDVGRGRGGVRVEFLREISISFYYYSILALLASVSKKGGDAPGETHKKNLKGHRPPLQFSENQGHNEARGGGRSCDPPWSQSEEPARQN
jgi:hypothetical protein